MLYFLAQQAADAEESNVWVDLLVAWGPVLIIAALIYYAIHSHNKRAKTQMDRLFKHMDAVERNGERVNELLESLNSRLERRE